ncbi:MAG: glycosyltransferase family 2 protein [bacterium]|nr:glycosyltransferase family 2 protein [bacterium]
MTHFPDLTVMIPALNEGVRLESTLRNLCAALEKTGVSCEALVIDDGSSDETGQIADALAQRLDFVRVIHHRENLGLGASLREAIREARGERFMIVPGDDDLKLDTLTLLFDRIDAAELVMCYFPNRAERNSFRNYLSDLFRGIYRWTFGVNLHYINGPALYPTKQLKQLDLCSTRFSIVAEINVKLLRQGFAYLQVAGSRQRGAPVNSALTWGSFREVVRVFVSLVWQVHFAQRSRFSRRPREVG